MKKILVGLFLAVLVMNPLWAANDCVTSPYDGKKYCCNLRDKNLPDGAINKSWGEVIPWDKYYGTVRKCIGGRINDDQFGPEIDGVAPNLFGQKIRKEASKYKIAMYTKFDGTYWYEQYCRDQNEGSFSTNFDYDTGGCRFEGLFDVGDKFYKCGEFEVPNAGVYITEVTGKRIYYKNEGDMIKRPLFVYRCLEGGWRGTAFCSEADMPTDAELLVGVLDNLDKGWSVIDGGGCWTRGTAENVQTKETKNTKNSATQNGEIKYNYASCSSSADCNATTLDLNSRQYRHSTAWQCIEQTSGVHVCVAKDCETGWHVKQGFGFCEEDAPASTNTQNSAGDWQKPGAATVSKTTTSQKTQKKTCTDPDNMDANCRCTIVAETTERGGKCVCIDTNKEIKKGRCEYTATYIAEIESELDSKYASLSATIGGFKKNVWRDEDGNFNTARLASDSIAGVVLGTVGGIVTANLVKKAQVKQGFEDIGCYIGGQSVANYGDEFMVGR